MKRVVVTGLGIISSIGNNKQEAADSLRDGSVVRIHSTILNETAGSGTNIVTIELNFDGNTIARFAGILVAGTPDPPITFDTSLVVKDAGGGLFDINHNGKVDARITTFASDYIIQRLAGRFTGLSFAFIKTTFCKFMAVLAAFTGKVAGWSSSSC